MNSFSYGGMGGTGGSKIESDPIKGLEAQRSRFNLEQERAMAPYQLGQARTSLQTSQFNLGQARQLAPYQLGEARLGLERGQFGFEQEKARAPWELRGLQAQTGMGELGLERGRSEFGEYQAGAGLRGMQRQLGEAETSIGLAGIGDVREAGQRAYTMGREAEELERLRMAGEGRRLQSQMSFLPQMEALRGGIASKMASSLGVGLPQSGRAYQSGTGYTPSWMQNYQSPSFPRF